jgi:hypothetical protein
MTSWRWTALFAVGVAAILAGFSAIPGMRACGGGDPIFAFEMAISPASVEALFPPECRAAHIVAQRNGLFLDIVAFVPVYSLFLMLGVVSLAREGGASALVRFAIGAVVVAAALDQYENALLLGILDGFPGDQADFDHLYFPPRAKFLLLGLAVAATGMLHLARPGWRKLAGGVALVGGVGSAVAVVVREDLVLAASAVAWLALIVAAIVLALRGRRGDLR